MAVHGQLRRVPRFVLVVLACASHGICARAWAPIPAAGREKPAQGITVADSRVLVPFGNALYGLPEGGEAWFLDSALSSKAGNFLSLQATPSFHFLAALNGHFVLDSAGQLRKIDRNEAFRFEGGIQEAKDVAEDSARLYIRLYNDAVLAAEKSTLEFGPMTSMPPVLEMGSKLILFPDRILARAREGLYRSRDRGATWEYLRAVPLEELVPGEYVQFLERFGNDVYVGMDRQGVYRSTDRGDTWTPLFPAGSPYRTLSFDDIEASGDTLWLAAAVALPSSQGILRSVDGGRTWSWHHAGMEPVVESDPEGGGQFRYYPVHQVARGGGLLWARGLSEFYQSRDGGASWTVADTELPTGNFLEFFALGDDQMAVAYGGGSGDDGTGHQVYAYEPSARKWSRDTTFPSGRYIFKAAAGDTAFLADAEGLKRRAGKGNPWESLSVPWEIDPDDPMRGPPYYCGIYPAGSELYLVDERPTLHRSEDGGRTWNTQRPFLPKASYRGALVEARGRLLCFPDDSLHTPPRPWREFPQPIRGIWALGGKLAIRAGHRVYLTDGVGEPWQEKALPDTGMELGVRNGVLTGFSVDTVWSLGLPGNTWLPRPVRFPSREVKNLVAGPRGFWTVTQPNYGQAYSSLYFQGTDGESQASSWSDAAHTLKLADGGSYLMAAWRGVLDTVQNSAQGVRRGFSFPAGKLHPAVASGITAIFGEEDFMAEALGSLDFRVSRDRGKTWNAVGKLPGASEKLAGSPACLFSLSGGTLYVSQDMGRTWTPASPGTSLASVAGRPDFLAAVAADASVLLSVDSARTWRKMPALPPGPGIPLTHVAVREGEILVGTREHGVFRWDETGSSGARRPGRDAAARVPDFRRGWVRVPGQGLQYRLAPDFQVDAKGRKGVAKPAGE